MTKPAQYTRTKTRYPVGLYMPGVYFTEEYVAWRAKQDALQPPPFEYRPLVTPLVIPDVKKSAERRPIEDRECEICGQLYTPVSGTQRVCDGECRRELERQREQRKRDLRRRERAERRISAN